MPLSLLDEVRVPTAQVFAIAVVEFDTCPGTQRRSRGRKKCVGRTQDGLAGHLEEIENGGRGAGPVVEPNRWQFVPRFPGRLELFKFGAMAPVISTQQAAPATDPLILVSRIESDAKRKGRRVCDIATHITRSEERRVGKACVRTCRSWWSPYK